MDPIIQPVSQESVVKVFNPASTHRSLKDKIIKRVIEVNTECIAQFHPLPQQQLLIDQHWCPEKKDGFLNKCDADYLKSYAIEHLTDLFEREKPNCFENLFDYGEEFQLKFGCRKHRMYFIDRIFGVAAMPEMQLTDKSVVF